VPLVEGQADTLRVKVPDAVTLMLAVPLREYVAVGEAEGHALDVSDTLSVDDTDAVKHKVGEPLLEVLDVGHMVTVPLADVEPLLLRLTVPVDDTDTEDENVNEPLLEPDEEVVLQPEGVSEGVVVALEHTVTVMLAEGHGDELRDMVSVPLVLAHPVAVSDPLSVGEFVADRQIVGDPEVDALLEGQIVAVPLREGEEVTLRDTVPNAVTLMLAVPLREYVAVGEAEGHVEVDNVGLTVGDAEEVRQREGVPELDEDDDGHMVALALALGQPVPLRVIVPVEDTEIDVENVKEPLLEPEEDGVLQPVGDTDGDSDDELQ